MLDHLPGAELDRLQLRVMATARRRALFDQRDETIGDAGRYWQQCEFTREALDRIDARLAVSPPHGLGLGILTG